MPSQQKKKNPEFTVHKDIQKAKLPKTPGQLEIIYKILEQAHDVLDEEALLKCRKRELTRWMKALLPSSMSKLGYKELIQNLWTLVKTYKPDPKAVNALAPSYCDYTYESYLEKRATQLSRRQPGDYAKRVTENSGMTAAQLTDKYYPAATGVVRRDHREKFQKAIDNSRQRSRPIE